MRQGQPPTPISQQRLHKELSSDESSLRQCVWRADGVYCGKIALHHAGMQTLGAPDFPLISHHSISGQFFDR
jgi:hypothetical protein